MAIIQVDISSSSSMMVKLSVSPPAGGRFARGECYLWAFPIFFMCDPGFRPSTWLPPDLLPFPLLDIFVGLIKGTSKWQPQSFEFESQLTNLVGSLGDKDGEKRPAAAAVPLLAEIDEEATT